MKVIVKNYNVYSANLTLIKQYYNLIKTKVCSNRGSKNILCKGMKKKCKIDVQMCFLQSYSSIYGINIDTIN